jgi:hypothetical protein
MVAETMRLGLIVALFGAIIACPALAQWEVKTQDRSLNGSGHALMSVQGRVPDDAFAALLGVICVPRTPAGTPALDPVIFTISLGDGFARFDGTQLRTFLDSLPVDNFKWKADSAGQLATLYNASPLVSVLSRAETLRVELPLLVTRRIVVAFPLGNFGALFEARARPSCK